MVWIMAAELQGKYLIVSRSDYKCEVEAWLPKVFVLWHDEENQMRSRHFENLGRCFKTQTAAEDFGITVARAWIIDKV
jgi:hypothetical protein